MSSNPYWQLMLQSTLVALPEWGIAYYPPHIPASHVYGREYFEEYQRRSNTDIGEALNDARTKMVRNYDITGDNLLDIGVGSGAFVRAYPCWGYDINAAAVDMLIRQDRFITPNLMRGDVSMTFWDSLEHIPDPKPLLDLITDYAFVSTPIYPNLHTLKKSKHYKPNEHCWYFTHDGLIQFMKAHAFSLIEWSDIETQLGREAISSYVFARPHVTPAHPR